jgi:S1-C subfamily serine protease
MASRILTLLLHACFAAIFLSSLAPTAQAQLPRDVRDMFEAMLDDLDDDLQAKFSQAIKDDTATVEFTSEEFIRFRDDPINPFEGLDRIEVKEGGGNIALQFELPSIRNRVLKPFERQDPDQLERLNPVVSELVPSVVSVMSDKRQIALGTVVDSNGFVVTKASEVNSRKYLTVVTSDGKEHESKLVYENEANDIAVLKVDTTLQAIEWKTAEAEMGQFIVLPAPNGKVFSMGTYSVGPRTTQTGRRAQLGVNPDNVPGGVVVSEIEAGTAAANAGLMNGDVITSVDGEPIEDVDGLVNAIRKNAPGDTIRIEYLRDGVADKTAAVLDSVDLSGDQAKRYKMMSRLGAIPSKRADNFPSVFQHDAPLFPEQCGGPVVDLAGNILGINIARNGRASTYAVPLEDVQQLFRQYLREEVAARE